MLLFVAAKFMSQFVDTGISTVHVVAGLNVTALDVAKPLSCTTDYNCCHGLEPTVYFPLPYGFQDLAHISVKL